MSVKNCFEDGESPRNEGFFEILQAFHHQEGEKSEIKNNNKKLSADSSQSNFHSLTRANNC